MDLLEELLVIAHMLKHFDRNDAVEFGFGFEFIDIAGDDAEVRQPSGACLTLDVFALGV